jgi:ATP synthase protein I
MASEANRPGKGTGNDPRETELSDRLRRLGERLPSKDEAAPRATGTSEGSDAGGIGRAMRLSTEFIGGVVAGALLGWVVDRLLGTSPWGLIILLMLGFAAGIMNVMRGAGMLGGPRSGSKGS